MAFEPLVATRYYGAEGNFLYVAQKTNDVWAVHRYGAPTALHNYCPCSIVSMSGRIVVAWEGSYQEDVPPWRIFTGIYLHYGDAYDNLVFSGKTLFGFGWDYDLNVPERAHNAYLAEDGDWIYLFCDARHATDDEQISVWGYRSMTGVHTEWDFRCLFDGTPGDRELLTGWRPVAIDNEGTIHLITQGGQTGLFYYRRSTDGGSNWSARVTFPEAIHGGSLFISCFENLVWVSSHYGLWRSTDFGLTWADGGTSGSPSPVIRFSTAPYVYKSGPTWRATSWLGPSTPVWTLVGSVSPCNRVNGYSALDGSGGVAAGHHYGGDEKVYELEYATPSEISGMKVYKYARYFGSYGYGPTVGAYTWWF